MTVNRNIDSLRGMHRLTQEAFAGAVNIAQPTLSAIRRGRSPGLSTLFKVSEFFGVTIDELLGDTESCLAAGLRSYNSCPALRFREDV